MTCPIVLLTSCPCPCQRRNKIDNVHPVVESRIQEFAVSTGLPIRHYSPPVGTEFFTFQPSHCCEGEAIIVYIFLPFLSIILLHHGGGGGGISPYCS